MQSSPRRRSVPRHLPTGIAQTYYRVAPASTVRRRRTHTTEKYDPRRYLPDSPLRNNVSNLTAAHRQPVTTFEYECKIRGSLQLPPKDYQRLVTILSKYHPTAVKMSDIQKLKRISTLAEASPTSSILSPDKLLPTITPKGVTSSRIHNTSLRPGLATSVRKAQFPASPLIVNDRGDGSTLIECEHLREVRHALNRSENVGGAGRAPENVVVDCEDDCIRTVVKENQRELKQIFDREYEARKSHDDSSSSDSSDEAASPADSSPDHKLHMRRKWARLQRKTLFRFEIDQVNDSVTLRRVHRGPEELEKPREHVVHKTIGADSSTLSPYLQRRKTAITKQRRGSVSVYFGLTSESEEATKRRGSSKGSEQIVQALQQKTSVPVVKRSSGTGRTEPARMGVDLEALWLKARGGDAPKMQIKLEKFFARSQGEVAFDLSRLDTAKMESADYVTLYMSLKSALCPNFYATKNASISQLDPEIADLALAKSTIPSGLTPYDTEVLSEYSDYLVRAGKGELFSGFWTVKRTTGRRPVCRECLHAVAVGQRIYMFGGYGVDKLNDLWCLSEATDYLWNWTLINPIGKSVPEKRFGHCMTAYRNKIYVHGGGGEYVAGLRVRASMGDTWIYSIEDNTWAKLKEETGRTAKLSPRRVSAAAACLDHLWIIHGGYDGSRENVLSDFTGFDLNTDKFVELTLPNNSKPGNKIGPLTMHTAVSVLPDWLTKRSENSDYWNNFHKWKFTTNDGLTVRFHAMLNLWIEREDRHLHIWGNDN